MPGLPRHPGGRFPRARALEMSRTSDLRYLSTPGRSACPGLGRVISRRSAPSAPPSALIAVVQFSQSRLVIRKDTGLPRVSPCRTPARISTRSRSIFIRPPRP